MKNFLAILLLSATMTGTILAQSWLQPHTQINLPNAPAKATLSELISANGGNSIGMTQMPNAGSIKTMRNFHHMEIDYKYNYFPMDGILNPDTCGCANVWCNNGGCSDILAPATKSGFESTKGFYCAWKGNNFGFTTMYSALESLFPKHNANCPNTTINRGYPNKWYSLTEFGGMANAAQNFENYVTSFLKTNCPKDPNKPALVNVLEIGNEPWGDPYPGKLGYHQLLIGTVSACRKYYGTNNPASWRIQLSLAAFRAHNANPGPFGEQFYYVDEAIPDSLKPYFSYCEIHPYAFNIPQFNQGNLNAGVTETPESDDGGYLTFKNMIDWKNQKFQHAKVNITEFGWNAGTANDGCGPLGESTQAAYYMRAYLLAARYNIHRAFVYGYTDQNEYPLYCTTGLFKDINNNIPRKSYRSIVTTVNSTVKDKRFLKALTENTNQANNGQNGKFVYLFGDSAGTPTHIIAWKPVKLGFEDTNYPALSSSYDTIQLPSQYLWAMSGDAYYYLGWDNSQNGTIANTASGTVYINGMSTNPNQVYVKLSGIPVVIPIHSLNCRYDSTGNLVNCGPATYVNYMNNEYDVNIQFDGSSITIHSSDLAGPATLSVYNSIGQPILQSNIELSAHGATLGFKAGSVGMYIVKVETADGFTFAKKILAR